MHLTPPQTLPRGSISRKFRYPWSNCSCDSLCGGLSRAQGCVRWLEGLGRHRGGRHEKLQRRRSHAQLALESSLSEACWERRKAFQVLCPLRKAALPALRKPLPVRLSLASVLIVELSSFSLPFAFFLLVNCWMLEDALKTSGDISVSQGRGKIIYFSNPFWWSKV